MDCQLWHGWFFIEHVQRHFMCWSRPATPEMSNMSEDDREFAKQTSPQKDPHRAEDMSEAKSPVRKRPASKPAARPKHVMKKPAAPAPKKRPSRRLSPRTRQWRRMSGPGDLSSLLLRRMTILKSKLVWCEKIANYTGFFLETASKVYTFLVFSTLCPSN